MKTPAGGYLSVLRLPHALRVFIPNLLARLSFATVSLALLYSVQGSTGSFAVAGTAAGAFGLANVIASPFRARLVDRWGQTLTLPALAAVYSAGLVALAILTARPGAFAVLLVALATATGAFAPPLGAAMRVLWGSIATTPALRTRAYSLDAVAEELLFTLGPLIVAVIIAATSPGGGLLATAAFVLVGTVAMVTGTASRAHPAATERAQSRLRPLRQPGFLPVLAALAGVGIVLGVIDVAAPALGEEHGSPVLAGAMLAALSAGSMVGGYVYGHRAWSAPLSHRLIVIGGILVAVNALLSLAPGVVTLCIGIGVVGLFLAPSMVTGYLAADELTSPLVRTEASAWINTAVNTGAAIATALGGALIDAGGTPLVFVAGAAAAVCCLAAAAFPLWRIGAGSRPVGSRLPDTDVGQL